MIENGGIFLVPLTRTRTGTRRWGRRSHRKPQGLHLVEKRRPGLHPHRHRSQRPLGLSPAERSRTATDEGIEGPKHDESALSFFCIPRVVRSHQKCSLEQCQDAIIINRYVAWMYRRYWYVLSNILIAPRNPGVFCVVSLRHWTLGGVEGLCRNNGW